MQAPVVPPVDPSGGGPLDVGQVSVGPGMEDRGADALGFEQPDHGLHQRVVVRIGHGPDRGADALELEMLGERDRRVLTGFNRSMQHLPFEGTVVVRRMLRLVFSIRVLCGVAC